MADESSSHVVRGIQWREAFPFTNLFRTFRIAIHPSKLVLGLLALLSLYVGGRILDGIWPARHLAVPNEATLYQQHARAGGDTEDFDEARTQAREVIEEEHAQRLAMYGIQTDHAKALEMARQGDGLGEVKDKIKKALDDRVTAVHNEYTAAIKDADALPEADARKPARDEAWKRHEDDVHSAWDVAIAEMEAAEAVKGRGIFGEFFEYEVRQVDGVVASVLAWNWLGGDANDATPGVIPSIVNFFTVGPVWLLREHTLYFILFALLFLLVWSVFSGAIARIAAVHVARDEKISVRQALRFSIGKLLSFVFAPIIPLLIVAVVGAVVAAVATIGWIPYVGPIVIGAAFFLALVAGFIMALVLLGTAGGFNLMYPTIAVEGSDSFDAISRSFSYVYARPWRMLFYTAVAIIYGALTYLFVRLFIWLMLVLTRLFVSFGMQSNAPNGGELIDAMWPSPATPWTLSYSPVWPLLDWGAATGAGLLAFWVYLAIGMLGAFAISFYFSANTIIYYLMRHEVDATEMDDVFLEQSEEEITESPSLAAPTTTTTSAPTAPTTMTTPESAAPSTTTTTTTDAPLAATPEDNAPPTSQV